MLQETTLFSGTIRDNIAYGKPRCNMDQVIAAANAAAADEFISDFPHRIRYACGGTRIDTFAEGRSSASPSHAALLLNPRILILDDSTSSVDLATEYPDSKGAG